MEIREAQPKDTNSIAAIGRCVWVDTYAIEGVRESISKYVMDEFTDENILKKLHDNKVFVLGVENHSVGYSVVKIHNNGEVEMETLYILPKFQGKGYGTQLLKHATNTFKSIRLSCWEKNVKAITFYTNNGFAKVGECYFEFDGEQHKNVILTNNTEG